MKGRVAVVTGAGRGHGQAVALRLGLAGTRVAAVDVNPDAAHRTADAIAEAGGEARAEVVDVSNKLAVQTMLYAVLEAWERIDLLVNAAHIVPPSPALKLDEWEWHRTLDVNLKGPFLLAQTAARAMQTTGGGLILNLVRPEATTRHAGVRAARAGLLGLTEALAEEWAPLGVVVAAVETSGVPDQVASQVLQHYRTRLREEPS